MAFCCDLTAMTGTERLRYAELRTRLEQARETIQELDNGYAFRFVSGAVSFVEVAEFVDKESKCCPFLDFEISLEREHGPLCLKITGQEGVKDFLRAEFAVR
jgi:hypothetical protein